MSQHMFPIIYREVIKNPLILSDKNIGESIISTALMRCSMVNRTPITWVRKLTPYEIHWADLMVIPDLRNTSQLHMLNASQGADFISACIKTLLAMQETGIIGIPVIALNQQRDCTEISTKYAPDGEELKVQTLDELHAHVFIEDETGIKYPTLAKLQKSINKKDASAKVDFFDPIAQNIIPLIIDVLSHLESLSELDITNTNNSFPWGININLETKFENLKASWLFTILQNIQSFYYQLYDTQDKISLYMNTNNIESVLAFQKLKFIKSILKGRENEKRKYMRLVQGPALTWVIYEKDNKVRINLAPRILSRGNAMEALGIWVEHKSLSPKESDKREQKAQLYYRQLEKKFKLLV